METNVEILIIRKLLDLARPPRFGAILDLAPDRGDDFIAGFIYFLIFRTLFDLAPRQIDEIFLFSFLITPTTNLIVNPDVFHLNSGQMVTHLDASFTDVNLNREPSLIKSER